MKKTITIPNAQKQICIQALQSRYNSLKPYDYCDNIANELHDMLGLIGILSDRYELQIRISQEHLETFSHLHDVDFPMFDTVNPTIDTEQFIKHIRGVVNEFLIDCDYQDDKHDITITMGGKSLSIGLCADSYEHLVQFLNKIKQDEDGEYSYPLGDDNRLVIIPCRDYDRNIFLKLDADGKVVGVNFHQDVDYTTANDLDYFSKPCPHLTEILNRMAKRRKQSLHYLDNADRVELIQLINDAIQKYVDAFILI